MLGPARHHGVALPRATLAGLACVAVAVAVAHGPALSAGFVAFDDDLYVYANPQVQQGLTQESIGWAFRLEPRSTYYHPLTWLSLMLDATVFGPGPFGFHLMNVLLHATSAALLLLLLSRATGLAGPSTGAALLFAVHPLTVESVAWVTERKATLSTALLLGAMVAYVRFSEGPSRRRLAPVLALVVAAVLAKPAAVVAPALMLVLDFWPLGRLHGVQGCVVGGREVRRAILEKLPIVGVALAALVPSLVSQGLLVATGPKGDWPMGIRVQNAFASIPSYLGAFVWPEGLSVYRLFPERIAIASVLHAALLVLAISALVAWAARRWPFLPAGWAWFLVALGPYLGIVRNGLWPRWADRFAYVALIGLAIAASFGLHAIIRDARNGRRLAAALAIAAVLPLALAARAQGAHWQDSLALFSRGAAQEPGSYVMNFGLARELVKLGRLPESLPALEASLRIYPTSAAAHVLYAGVLARLGRPVEAAIHYQEALRLDPGLAGR